MTQLQCEPSAKLFKKRHLQAGAILSITLFLTFVLGMLALAMFTLSNASTQIANSGLQKVQATSLAESGVHALYAQIQNSLYSNSYSPSANAISGALGTNGSYSGTLVAATSPTLPGASDTTTTTTNGNVQTQTETTISNSASTTPASTTTTVEVKQTNTGTNAVISDTSQSTTVQAYIFTVQGFGTAPNGTKSTSQATFETTRTTHSGLNYFTFPDGALVSNGNIQLQGSSKTKDPSTVDLHGAGALSNGIVTNVGSAYYVDGQIGVAPNSYAGTVSALSPIQDAFGTITQLAGQIPFPSTALVNNIEATWLTAAQKSSVTYASTAIPSTITGSCVINGNLDLTHGLNLTLNPGSGSQPIVVYVNGNINYANGNGAIYNNGVILVCTGTFYLGNNGTYVSSNLQNSLMASLSTSSTAVTITGNSTMTVGICQALNGGVLLRGNGTLTGSIQACKGGANGGIALQGNPTVVYPPGLNSNSMGDTNNPPPPHYLAGPLSQWVQIL